MMRTAIAILGSKTATLILSSMFVLYYLTVAVWSKEAFASIVKGLSSNFGFQVWYVLLLLNVAIRSIRAASRLRHHRVMMLLRLPLYAGVVLFLLFFFLSLNARERRLLVVGEGDIISLPWDEMPLRVEHVVPALERNSLKTKDSAIFDYEPGLVLMDAVGNRYDIGAFPATRVGRGYMHVLNFGIGPGVELKKDGETLMKGEVALRLTPFGSVDTFEFSPYVVYMSILPSRTIKKGGETAREYDLSKPLYHVEIVKGEQVVAKGDTDTAISFENGMTLSFLTPADWVLLEAVYDPFYPLFVFSLILLLAGLCLQPVRLIVWLVSKNKRSISG